MKKQMIKVEKKSIFVGSEAYFRKICGFSRDETGNLIEEAWKVRKKYEENLSPDICIAVNDKKEKDTLYVSYAMAIQEVDTAGLDLLEQFYLDAWMTAILDSARDWLRLQFKKFFISKKEKNVYVSPAFGPGFFGMPLECISDIIQETDAEKMGIFWNGKSLVPPKSNVGYYMISEKNRQWEEGDCRSCLSGEKNCNYCKKYTF